MEHGKKKGPLVPASKPNWTPIDAKATESILAHSDSPGRLFPLEPSELPLSLRPMDGVTAYYVSSYTEPLVISASLTAGGELAVGRVDGDVRKNYNYIFATSSDGKVYFNGPYKDFPEHHGPKEEPVVYITLFGHTPFK